MIWVWGRIKDQTRVVPCISLLLFKPSHTYTAFDLTTGRVTTMNKNHNQPPRLPSFRITRPDITNLRQMVVPLKITGFQDWGQSAGELGFQSQTLPRESSGEFVESHSAAQGFTKSGHETLQGRRQPDLPGPQPHCRAVLMRKRLSKTTLHLSKTFRTLA